MSILKCLTFCLKYFSKDEDAIDPNKISIDLKSNGSTGILNQKNFKLSNLNFDQVSPEESIIHSIISNPLVVIKTHKEYKTCDTPVFADLASKPQINFDEKECELDYKNTKKVKKRRSSKKHRHKNKRRNASHEDKYLKSFNKSSKYIVFMDQLNILSLTS